MTSAPDPARRWARSPIDARSHLLAEQDNAATGMLVTECGQLMPCSVDTSPHPPPGPQCQTCALTGSQGRVPLPVTGPEPVREPDPQLLAALALRRAHRTGVTKLEDRYLDHGFPMAGYLTEPLDELTEAGLLALADLDPMGLRRVTLTPAGQARYTQLWDVPRRVGLPAPESRFPSTAATAPEHQSGTPSPVRDSQPDLFGGRGPVMQWARCPADGRLHAIKPTTKQAPMCGHTVALCGHHLPAEDLTVQDAPSGALCLPCLMRITADMLDRATWAPRKEPPS